MSLKEEITSAIGAHGMWKARLKMAIASGKIDIEVGVIGRDDQCAFGKWLYGTSIDPAHKSSPNYATVKQLHADFHRHAAKIAALATTGRKTEAEALLRPGGEYLRISSELTRAMSEWEKQSG